MTTYFDKKTDEMKRHWYKKCETLLKQCERLQNEADKLYDEAEKHLEDAKELQWEECLRSAIEKENYARGIMDTLKELEFVE